MFILSLLPMVTIVILCVIFIIFNLNDRYYVEDDKIIIKYNKKVKIINIKDIKHIEKYRNSWSRMPRDANEFTYMIITFDKKERPKKLKRYNDSYYVMIANESFLEVIEKYNLKLRNGQYSFKI